MYSSAAAIAVGRVADTGAGEMVFRPRSILMGRKDGDAALRRLHEKATRGEAFTGVDRIVLILSPLMRQRRPVTEVARDAARLTDYLPQAQREMTVGALLGLSYPEISDDVAIAILGELGMTALSQALEARGELKGKRAALRKILHGRFGALPRALEERIDEADSAQLDGLLDRAIAVESVADL